MKEKKVWQMNDKTKCKDTCNNMVKDLFYKFPNRDEL